MAKIQLEVRTKITVYSNIQPKQAYLIIAGCEQSSDNDNVFPDEEVICDFEM